MKASSSTKTACRCSRNSIYSNICRGGEARRWSGCRCHQNVCRELKKGTSNRSNSRSTLSSRAAAKRREEDSQRHQLRHQICRLRAGAAAAATAAAVPRRCICSPRKRRRVTRCSSKVISIASPLAAAAATTACCSAAALLPGAAVLSKNVPSSAAGIVSPSTVSTTRRGLPLSTSTVARHTSFCSKRESYRTSTSSSAYTAAAAVTAAQVERTSSVTSVLLQSSKCCCSSRKSQTAVWDIPAAAAAAAAPPPPLTARAAATAGRAAAGVAAVGEAAHAPGAAATAAAQCCCSDVANVVAYIPTTSLVSRLKARAAQRQAAAAKAASPNIGEERRLVAVSVKEKEAAAEHPGCCSTDSRPALLLAANAFEETRSSCAGEQCDGYFLHHCGPSPPCSSSAKSSSSVTLTSSCSSSSASSPELSSLCCTSPLSLALLPCSEGRVASLSRWPAATDDCFLHNNSAARLTAAEEAAEEEAATEEAAAGEEEEEGEKEALRRAAARTTPARRRKVARTCQGRSESLGAANHTHRHRCNIQQRGGRRILYSSRESEKDGIYFLRSSSSCSNKSGCSSTSRCSSSGSNSSSCDSSSSGGRSCGSNCIISRASSGSSHDIHPASLGFAKRLRKRGSVGSAAALDPTLAAAAAADADAAGTFSVDTAADLTSACSSATDTSAAHCSSASGAALRCSCTTAARSCIAAARGRCVAAGRAGAAAGSGCASAPTAGGEAAEGCAGASRRGAVVAERTGCAPIEGCCAATASRGGCTAGAGRLCTAARRGCKGDHQCSTAGAARRRSPGEAGLAATTAAEKTESYLLDDIRRKPAFNCPSTGRMRRLCCSNSSIRNKQVTAGESSSREIPKRSHNGESRSGMSLNSSNNSSPISVTDTKCFKKAGGFLTNSHSRRESSNCSNSSSTCTGSSHRSSSDARSSSTSSSSNISGGNSNTSRCCFFGECSNRTACGVACSVKKIYMPSSNRSSSNRKSNSSQSSRRDSNSRNSNSSTSSSSSSSTSSSSSSTSTSSSSSSNSNSNNRKSSICLSGANSVSRCRSNAEGRSSNCIARHRDGSAVHPGLRDACENGCCRERCSSSNSSDQRDIGSTTCSISNSRAVAGRRAPSGALLLHLARLALLALGPRKKGRRRTTGYPINPSSSSSYSSYEYNSSSSNAPSSDQTRGGDKIPKPRLQKAKEEDIKEEEEEGAEGAVQMKVELERTDAKQRQRWKEDTRRRGRKDSRTAQEDGRKSNDNSVAGDPSVAAALVKMREKGSDVPKKEGRGRKTAAGETTIPAEKDAVIRQRDETPPEMQQQGDTADACDWCGATAKEIGDFICRRLHQPDTPVFRSSLAKLLRDCTDSRTMIRQIRRGVYALTDTAASSLAPHSSSLKLFRRRLCHAVPLSRGALTDAALLLLSRQQQQAQKQQSPQQHLGRLLEDETAKTKEEPELSQHQQLLHLSKEIAVGSAAHAAAAAERERALHVKRSPSGLQPYANASVSSSSSVLPDSSSSSYCGFSSSPSLPSSSCCVPQSVGASSDALYSPHALPTAKKTNALHRETLILPFSRWGKQSKEKELHLLLQQQQQHEQYKTKNVSTRRNPSSSTVAASLACKKPLRGVSDTKAGECCVSASFSSAPAAAGHTVPVAAEHRHAAASQGSRSCSSSSKSRAALRTLAPSSALPAATFSPALPPAAGVLEGSVPHAAFSPATTVASCADVGTGGPGFMSIVKKILHSPVRAPSYTRGGLYYEYSQEGRAAEAAAVAAAFEQLQRERQRSNDQYGTAAFSSSSPSSSSSSSGSAPLARTAAAPRDRPDAVDGTPRAAALRREITRKRKRSGSADMNTREKKGNKRKSTLVTGKRNSNSYRSSRRISSSNSNTKTPRSSSSSSNKRHMGAPCSSTILHRSSTSKGRDCSFMRKNNFSKQRNSSSTCKRTSCRKTKSSSSSTSRRKKSGSSSKQSKGSRQVFRVVCRNART